MPILTHSRQLTGDTSSLMTKNQIHEWRERGEDGVKRYYRGYWNSRDWSFGILEPGADYWAPLELPTLHNWKSLRDVIFRKYQRKRLPHKFIVHLDEMIAKFEELEPEPKDPTATVIEGDDDY